MHSFTRGLATLAACGLALLVAACTAPAGEADAPGTVTVQAKDLLFQPRTVQVTAGQPVTIRLKNVGNLPHDWTIDAIPYGDATVEGSSSAIPYGMGAMPAPGTMGGGGMMGSGVPPATATAASDAATASSMLRVAADPKQTATIRFTPLKAGTYTFYCSIPGHRQAGMEGTLVVK